VQIEKNEVGWARSTYGEEKRRIQCFGGKPEGRDHLEYPGIDERIILRWIFGKWAWTGLIWLRIETGGGHL
jgi:hypothetical protein